MDGEIEPPLTGIRVLDFSRIIAGPLCTQQLADLGAEVIKLENTGTGEDVREIDKEGNPGRGAFFFAFNRSKKSVAVDLKSDTGQDIVKKLVKKCDVLIENFRPGVMKRFGLDPGTLRKANPALIYVSISAYGAEVPMSYRPGYDPILQAESGMMELTGEADGPPLRTALSMIDTLTAAHATSAICAALLARAKSGKGDFIDLALLDTAIGALGNFALEYLTRGSLPTRAGNAHIRATPTDLFKTKTRPIYMAVSSNRLFGQLCRDILEQPALANDDRFRTGRDRLRNRSELKAIIESVFAQHPCEHWLGKMRHLPVGEIRTLDIALESEEVAIRDMVRTIDEADGERIRVLGSPFKYTENKLAEFFSPPHHAEHTREVLKNLLKMDDMTISDLQRQGVIKIAAKDR